MWQVYILRCADGTLYTGSTNDVEKRLAAHNAGRVAKYPRARRPCALVYVEEAADKGAALRREAAIKKLSRQEKLRMIQYFHSCFYASNESSPWGFSRTDT